MSEHIFTNDIFKFVKKSSVYIHQEYPVQCLYSHGHWVDTNWCPLHKPLVIEAVQVSLCRFHGNSRLQERFLIPLLSAFFSNPWALSPHLPLDGLSPSPGRPLGLHLPLCWWDMKSHQVKKSTKVLTVLLDKAALFKTLKKTGSMLHMQTWMEKSSAVTIWALKT